MPNSPLKKIALTYTSITVYENICFSYPLQYWTSRNISVFDKLIGFIKHFMIILIFCSKIMRQVHIFHMLLDSCIPPPPMNFLFICLFLWFFSYLILKALYILRKLALCHLCPTSFPSILFFAFGCFSIHAKDLHLNSHLYYFCLLYLEQILKGLPHSTIIKNFSSIFLQLYYGLFFFIFKVFIDVELILNKEWGVDPIGPITPTPLTEWFFLCWFEMLHL